MASPSSQTMIRWAFLEEGCNARSCPGSCQTIACFVCPVAQPHGDIQGWSMREVERGQWSWEKWFEFQGSDCKRHALSDSYPLPGAPAYQFRGHIGVHKGPGAVGHRGPWPRAHWSSAERRESLGQGSTSHWHPAGSPPRGWSGFLQGDIEETCQWMHTCTRKSWAQATRDRAHPNPGSLHSPVLAYY